jgi:hypothetical protein
MTPTRIRELFVRETQHYCELGLMLSDEVDADAAKYLQLMAFLRDNPQHFSWRNRRIIIDSEEYYEKTAMRFVNGRHALPRPSPPSTIPDPAVGIVLATHYGIPRERLEGIEREHQNAMSSENFVGKLLERYLAARLEPHGWIWCAGDFVKAIDFLRPTNSGWQAIQVKNRDNSENSSSSAIRDGTDIDKWFRTYSRTGETNWHNFPGGDVAYGLSEDDFYAYIVNYFASAPAQ